MRKYDNSLLEVWEWKEKVYQDIKDLSDKEYIEKVKNDADKILSEFGLKLIAVSLRKEYQRIT